ncbi:hypothetical protein [Lentilactobacillus sunkii]|uniref:Uncharacterized protein n=1 Tax=Lentilactobacillus sunkii DSM 19904 TaxID=1423808 RepID=A0A0R1L4W8_9LACO|nr:hypothetical protein [Lentilactobacillus sunkii]KRK88755.1 hypothetical protein FD17_GL002225 [Lentilactobacillus sunkii DSM 19904]
MQSDDNGKDHLVIRVDFEDYQPLLTQEEIDTMVDAYGGYAEEVPTAAIPFYPEELVHLDQTLDFLEYHAPFAYGDRVQVVEPVEDYRGLVGTVKEYHPLGSLSHDTDNASDDVIVSFDDEQRELLSAPEYLPITENYPDVDDVPLDDVILAPESLRKLDSSHQQSKKPQEMA